MRVEQKTNVKNSIGRLLFVVIAVLLQLYWILSLIRTLSEQFSWISPAYRIAALILVLYIYGQHTNSNIKMPWIILILVLPIAGTALYVLIANDLNVHGMRKRFIQIDQQLLPFLPEHADEEHALKKLDSSAGNLAYYLKKDCGFPLYSNTSVTFYPEANLGLDAQKEALQKAQRFIFMEYHAIEDAESFDGILKILAEKAQSGVLVRVFYDDVGSIGFINTDFIKRLTAMGIECRVFNKVIPFLSFFMNNRDHRKITVIDGTVGFTGGYNLANEYFNLTHPFGHWKDTGIRLEGDGVRTLTWLFLEMWNAIHKSDTADTDLDQFFQTDSIDLFTESLPSNQENHPIRNNTATSGKTLDAGFVQPYGDSPLDQESTGENVYISILNQATDYVYSITPYLIITDEFSRALQIAAKRGVDVRIITPGIPDKKMIYQTTRSYYAALAISGVRIYEYTPGFCHAKQCISDDRIATIGTINLDYRSLYHHFENGCVLYHCPAIKEIKKDFTQTFSDSREVTEKYQGTRSRSLRLGQYFLRLIAPLL